jgi:hypothetical protein
MAEIGWARTPARPELVRLVCRGLPGLGTSLRVLARDVLGAEARIDLVTADADGRVTLVLLGGSEEDLALVALALAQRAWVEARLPDWIQLSPDLGLRAEGPVRVMLVAPAFSAPAVAAVRASGAEDIDLVRYRCLHDGSETQVLLEPERLAGGPVAPGPGTGPPPGARFRTGLSDADLVVSPAERRGLA